MPRQSKYGVNDHEVGPKIKGRATIPVGPSLTPTEARLIVGAMIEKGLVSFGAHPKTNPSNYERKRSIKRRAN